MVDIQKLRASIQQRLTAVAEEIFELFERTIAEYEETFSLQRELLHTVSKPRVGSQGADVHLMLVPKEEVPPEQQIWSTSLDQDDSPELPHINEEQQKLWTTKEGEQLEEVDNIKFTILPVPLRSEAYDEEKHQSSQLHHTGAKTAVVDGEDYGGLEQDKLPIADNHLQPIAVNEVPHYSEPETDDSRDWENGDCQSTGVKTFSCSFCGKKYNWKNSLTAHMRLHSELKCFSCSVCKKTFPSRAHFVRHMRIHTGERPFSCSVCSRTFADSGTLRRHLRIHTGEKPFSCIACDKSFTWLTNLKRHKCVGESSGSQ